MTRDEHMKWSKDRAIEIANSGDLPGAYASMTSDLQKHEETAGHIAIELGMLQMLGGHLNTKEEMIKFIDGFN